MCGQISPQGLFCFFCFSWYGEPSCMSLFFCVFLFHQLLSFLFLFFVYCVLSLCHCKMNWKMKLMMHGRQAKSHNSAPSNKRQDEGGAPHHQAGTSGVRRPLSDALGERGRDRWEFFMPLWSDCSILVTLYACRAVTLFWSEIFGKSEKSFRDPQHLNLCWCFFKDHTAYLLMAETKQNNKNY